AQHQLADIEQDAGNQRAGEQYLPARPPVRQQEEYQREPHGNGHHGNGVTQYAVVIDRKIGGIVPYIFTDKPLHRVGQYADHEPPAREKYQRKAPQTAEHDVPEIARSDGPHTPELVHGAGHYFQQGGGDEYAENKASDSDQPVLRDAAKGFQRFDHFL